MKIAVVSSETDNLSRTEIAFGILRDMKAAGLGKAIGVVKRFVNMLSNNIVLCWVCFFFFLHCCCVYWADDSSSVDVKTWTPLLRIFLQLEDISIYILKRVG